MTELDFIPRAMGRGVTERSTDACGVGPGDTPWLSGAVVREALPFYLQSPSTFPVCSLRQTSVPAKEELSSMQSP